MRKADRLIWGCLGGGTRLLEDIVDVVSFETFAEIFVVGDLAL